MFASSSRRRLRRGFACLLVKAFLIIHDIKKEVVVSDDCSCAKESRPSGSSFARQTNFGGADVESN